MAYLGFSQLTLPGYTIGRLPMHYTAPPPACAYHDVGFFWPRLGAAVGVYCGADDSAALSWPVLYAPRPLGWMPTTTRNRPTAGGRMVSWMGNPPPFASRRTGRPQTVFQFHPSPTSRRLRLRSAQAVRLCSPQGHGRPQSPTLRFAKDGAPKITARVACRRRGWAARGRAGRTGE